MDLIKNYEPAVENIRKDLRDYLTGSPLKSLVLGISGGIDSAIVAALVRPVCDELGVKLIGRYISITSNSPEETERARMVGQEFCHDFAEVKLDEEFFLLRSMDDNEGDIEDDDFNSRPYKIRMGNIKARMRMMYLYNLASKMSGLVLSTDNWTEYKLGFWTLHGDVGDFGPIQSLWKTEVYEMTDWLINNELYTGYADELTDKQQALIACVRCNATDGLGITNTDLDQILPDWKLEHKDTRSGYSEVDELINMFLTTGRYPKNTKKIVSDRVKASQFKRDNPYNTPRTKII